MSRTANMPLRGLYPLLDSGHIPLDMMAATARVLVDCGVSQLQLRLKTQSDAERLRVQDSVAGALDGRDVLIVINDRADLARMLEREAPPGVRAGLHLGQADMDPRRARDIVGDAVHVSWSTHTLDQVEASRALPLDGVAFGPVFETASKEQAEAAVGLSGLRKAVTTSPWPLTAIGGIDAGSIGECRDAGASSVAVIGALFHPYDLEAIEGRAASLMAEVV